MKEIHRLVVKVGTSSLTYPTGNINYRQLSSLCAVLSDIANSGVQIVLVSSGAIAVGVGKIGLDGRPKDVAKRQALAAIGQSELMALYDREFSQYFRKISQVLLTKDDIENEERKKYLLDAFEALFQYHAIPIVNENDTVSVEEILHGDNDCLSAEVAALIDADALVICSDIEGLYTTDPRTNEDARLIREVLEITPEIEAMAGGTGNEQGTGGMLTKINAAKIATSAGVDTYITSSKDFSFLYDLLEGKGAGTLFHGR